MMHLNSNGKMFLNFVSGALFGNEINVDDSVDFAEIYKEARLQTVDSLIFDTVSPCIKQNADLYNLWYKNTLYKISHNYKLESAHNSIGGLLAENNIKYCILKGCRSAYYYDYPYKRSLGDVDFLVNPCDVEKTCNLLEQNGFVRFDNGVEHDFHIIYIKDKLCYELHYRFDEEQGEQSDAFTNELISTAVDIPILEGKSSVKACDDAHHALVILLHTKRHLKTAGMGLRHLCDWAVFVNKFENDEFIENFKEVIERKGLWKYARALSLVANKYLGLPYKEWFGKYGEEVLSWLMEYIYSNGNFGRKEVTHAPLLSQNTDIGTSNRFAQIMTSLKNIVYLHWPKAKKNKLLLVVGLFYFPLKYLFNSLLGKRKKINVLKTVKDGSYMNYVFKELGFYEK